MKYLNNSNTKNNKTLGYSLIWNVNPNLYSRNNPMSWVIHSLPTRQKTTIHIEKLIMNRQDFK